MHSRLQTPNTGFFSLLPTLGNALAVFVMVQYFEQFTSRRTSSLATAAQKLRTNSSDRCDHQRRIE